jgi:hypothetical protein
METRKRFKKFAVINNKNKVIIQAQLPIRSEGSCIKGTAGPPGVGILISSFVNENKLQPKRHLSSRYMVLF